jgi:(E)-4-hydroxy-3-methylbut-2-enyl-diphosphate synthase
MCATKTTDLQATAKQIALLQGAGADVIRIAIDSRNDIDALKALRDSTDANLVVDLQENYRLAEKAGPYVQKFRYNPGHLHHHQKNVSVEDKVKFLADVAGEHDCAIRVGVNFGSLDPALKEQGVAPAEVALESALTHADLLESYGFTRFVVSLKSSDPLAVVAINKSFSEQRPHIPIHLGVTEAGMLPDGAIKTRIAFEQLLALGIGDTVRVSLTLPDDEKDKEIQVAREIVDDVAAGRFRSVPEFLDRGLNVISCPSCSRVENRAFVDLAHKVKDALAFAEEHKLTVAIMGCRVNGPGETDDADLGLWCAPTFVNLKRGEELVGKFSYDTVLDKLLEQVHLLIEERQSVA